MDAQGVSALIELLAGGFARELLSEEDRTNEESESIKSGSGSTAPVA